MSSPANPHGSQDEGPGFEHLRSGFEIELDQFLNRFSDRETGGEDRTGRRAPDKIEVVAKTELALPPLAARRSASSFSRMPSVRRPRILAAIQSQEAPLAWASWVQERIISHDRPRSLLPNYEG